MLLPLARQSVTDKQRAPAGFGPLAIGLALSLMRVISIPVTNSSEPGAQHWRGAFAGGAIGGRLYRALAEPQRRRETELFDVNIALASS
jgi:hypothetical protein